MQLRQDAWFQVYSAFGKPRPPDPRPAQSQPMRTQYPQYPQQPRPAYRPSPSQRTPQQPRVYWADEEEEDYYYDPPTDSFHAAPAHPPGHTPRRQGNTQDGIRGNEAIANWTLAGDDHRCSHEGCTHYH